jgi:hypothetical protein
VDPGHPGLEPGVARGRLVPLELREYEPHWLDRSYLLTFAVVTLLVGLGLERGLQRRLYEPL